MFHAIGEDRSFLMPAGFMRVIEPVVTGEHFLGAERAQSHIAEKRRGTGKMVDFGLPARFPLQPRRARTICNGLLVGADQGCQAFHDLCFAEIVFTSLFADDGGLEIAKSLGVEPWTLLWTADGRFPSSPLRC